MAYGTLKALTVRSIYRQTNPNNIPSSQNSAVNISADSIIRSGTNCTTFTKDGMTTSYIKCMKMVKRIIGYKTVVRTYRRILGSREIGGNPIYKTKRVYSPNGKFTKERYIVGYSEKRLRYIYTYEKYSFQKAIWGEVPKVYWKKRVSPATTGLIYPPNTLNYAHFKALGADAAATVFIKGLAPWHPPLDTVDFRVTGVRAFNWYLEFLPAAGINATSRSKFWSVESDQTYIKLQNQSVFKLNMNAQSGVAKISQIMAERLQIKRTILSLCTTVVENLLRGKRGLANRITDFLSDPYAISNAWLAYVYGVKPIIQDAQALYNELIHKENGWIRVKGVAKRSWTTYEQQKLPMCNITIREDYYVLVKNQVTLTGSSSASRFLGSHGLTNLSATLWEIVPWSFVADWFFPIGSWLSQSDAFEGAVIASWHETYIRKKTTTITVHYTGSHNHYEVQGSGALQVYFAENYECKRRLMVGTPPITTITFKNPLSVIHGANALALLIQQLKR